MHNCSHLGTKIREHDYIVQQAGYLISSANTRYSGAAVAQSASACALVRFAAQSVPRMKGCGAVGKLKILLTSFSSFVTSINSNGRFAATRSRLHPLYNMYDAMKSYRTVPYHIYPIYVRTYIIRVCTQMQVGKTYQVSKC